MEKILDKSLICSGSKMYIEDLKIDFANGNVGHFERMGFVGTKGGFGVMIAAVDLEANLYLVSQYQAGVESRELVLPRGVLPDNVDPEVQANLELQEEVGLKAGSLILLGQIAPFAGYVKAQSYLFLARDLSISSLQGDEIEAVLAVKIPLTEAILKIMNGEIRDARTIAGIFMAKEYLEIGN